MNPKVELINPDDITWDVHKTDWTGMFAAFSIGAFIGMFITNIIFVV